MQLRINFLEMVIKVIYEETGLDKKKNEITEESLLIKDLEIDLFDLTDILLVLEKKLNILIGEEGLIENEKATVKDIVDRIVEIFQKM